MTKEKCMSVEEASEIIGLGSQTIRWQMRKGRLPIGICIKSEMRWKYVIYRGWLERWLEGNPVTIPDGLSDKEDE